MRILFLCVFVCLLALVVLAGGGSLMAMPGDSPPIAYDGSASGAIWSGGDSVTIIDGGIAALPATKIAGAATTAFHSYTLVAFTGVQTMDPGRTVRQSAFGSGRIEGKWMVLGPQNVFYA